MSKEDLKKLLGGKSSTKEALIRRLDKAAKKETRKPRKKNGKPEKEVEKLVMEWLYANNFSCHVVESKAVYSASAGRYLRGQTVVGFPDVVGCDPNGIAVWIELKAPRKCRNLSDSQRDFLVRKIEMNCFGVCVDSPELLQHLYSEFRSFRVRNLKEKAQERLLNALPKKRKKRAKDDDGLGF